jgi:flagellar motility protein MotE (MotC chaperone)
MRDMVGALLRSVFLSIYRSALTFLSLKDMENDKLIAPDGKSIEDRLKILVERTADDIKTCSNVCDAYMKKRLLAKVLLGSVWDAKLLDFVKLFATRRQEFEFELTMHTSQSVDKANSKLDAIGEVMKALDEKFGRLSSAVLIY